MNIHLITNVKQALQSLWSNKLRSILTMTGMVIGVASVILLLAAGRGAQSLILQQVEDLGSNIVFAIAGGDGGRRAGPPAAVRGVVETSMKLSDVEELRKPGKAPSLRLVSAFTTGILAKVKIEGEDEVAISVRGRDLPFFAMRNYAPEFGRLWTEDEEKSLKRVALLGYGAKESIFGENSGNVVGKRLKIRGMGFEVIGVLEKKEPGLISAVGQDDDSGIIIPVTTMQKNVQGVDYILGIMAEVVSKERIEDGISEIERLLRDRHGLREGEDNDFSLRSQEDAISILGTVTSVFTVFLAAIAAISLVVGGINIMNIMIVTVTERTREIGLRKAIGASRSAILLQFLIEALVITFFGGIIGITIGLLGAYGLSLVGGWAFEIDVLAIVVALVVSAAFGIGFGMYPANKASKLDPILALRYE